MTARIKNPAQLLPEIKDALVALGTKINADGVIPEPTMELLHLRVSQLNGCAWCLNMGLSNARKVGISDEQLIVLAGWPESPEFSDAEKVALDLAEHITRLADRTDPVPDAVWDAAAQHYDEKQLSVLVTWVGVTNLYNRVNVSTRQVPGTW